jgi:DNA-directed RNA polymerase specialized sigma subunit
MELSNMITNYQKKLIEENYDKVYNKVNNIIKYKYRFVNFNTNEIMGYITDAAVRFDPKKSSNFYNYAKTFISRQFINYLRKTNKLWNNQNVKNNKNKTNLEEKKEYSLSHDEYNICDTGDFLKDIENRDLINVIKKTYKTYFSNTKDDPSYIINTNNIYKALIEHFILPKLENRDFYSISEIAEMLGTSHTSVFIALKRNKLKIYLNKLGIGND